MVNVLLQRQNKKGSTVSRGALMLSVIFVYASAITALLGQS
jgi:hypothetical protein